MVGWSLLAVDRGRHAARRAQVLALLLALAVGACAQSRTEYGRGLPDVAAAPGIQELEHEMGQRLNRDRAGQNLGALRYDERLANVARVHSADMRDHHFFEHESPNTGSLEDRLAAAGYLFLEARENLAEAPDVQQAQDRLLRSPEHHANIMATDITHVGVGIVRGGVREPRNLTITQVFARPGRAESPQAARQSMLEAVSAARQKQGLGKLASDARLDTLAAEHLADLPVPPTDSALQSVGAAISKQLQDEPLEGVRGVIVGSQLLPESSAFQVAPELLRPGTRHYGLGVSQVAGERGRPMLLVLVLIGS